MIELDRYSTILPDVNGFRWIPLDKARILLYNRCMSKSVIIRIRKETRDKLNDMKYPGQTLDGFITHLLDLWERQKLESTKSKKE